MQNFSLLVLAAGLGSRFGGLKQITSIGKNRESIIDYSVYDAIKSGFNKVVFVIQRELKKDFEEIISKKYEDKIQVELAFQKLNALPNGFSHSKERKSPWGTGHAILSAAHLIKEPFCVINADDFYGRESFEKMIDFFSKDFDNLSMVFFELGKTLSSFGGVNRAICEFNNGFLSKLIEMENIKKYKGIITSNNKSILHSRTPVSLNMWGLRPFIFDYFNEIFIKFLKKKGDDINSEFLIPSAMNDLIYRKSENVIAINSKSTWFGITYKEDVPLARAKIQKLVYSGQYPTSLF